VQGGETQVMTPGQFSALLKTDHAKWRSIAKASGATIEQGRRGRAGRPLAKKPPGESRTNAGSCAPWLKISRSAHF